MHHVALALFALTFAACSSPRTDSARVRVDSLHVEPDPSAAMASNPEELAGNRERWSARRPDSYRYTYTRTCFCPPQYRGPFEVTVRAGKVAAVTYKGEGEPVERDLSEYLTVDDLFALIAEAFDQDAARVDVAYDARTGQPVEVYIDYDERMADEEVGFTVEPARPLDG